MSSRRGGAAAAPQPPPRTGNWRPQPRGAVSPPAAPPPSVANSLPQLPGAAVGGSRRPEWAVGSPGGSAAEGSSSSGVAAAQRPASRTASRGGRAPSPEFWSRSTAPQLLDASVKHPEVKLQLLTRALEESRAKVAYLKHDRAALADAMLQLCMAAGAEGAEAGGETAGAGGSPVPPEALPAADDDEALARHLNLLSTRVQQLREALSVQEVAVAEAQQQHERAALQVVAQQQQQEALELQLEEARYSAQQHEQAQQALQLKVGLLEEQLAATADSARRRMEEQLDTFRGDAATARTLRNKFTELEQQLDASRRTQQHEANERSRLEAQVERLQGRLKEASAKQADLSQQLWDKTAAHNELASQHRALVSECKELGSENQQLRTSVATWQQRAQQAETLGMGLQAECQAARQLQAALQEEGERLKTELQQASGGSLEREQNHRLRAALAEEQVVGAKQRAALQGQGDEIASLLSKLEEYSNRIVAAEGALEGASRREEAEVSARRQAEQAAQRARHDNVSLRDSLADLASSEARWRQQLGQAEAALAESRAAAEALQWEVRQKERAAAASRDHIHLLQATLAEQAGQLEEMRAQTEGQQQQLASLTQELLAAAAERAAAQAAAEEAAAANQQVERSLHKQEVLARRLQEQSSQLSSQLQAATRDLAAAQEQRDELAGRAAQEHAEHAAAVAALGQAHEQRRLRNEHLEHENRQQAVVIAEMEALSNSLEARLEATQQHNSALHRYGVANGAAYGRLAAHVAGLQQQFTRQLGSLLSLCRHLQLQLAAALSAADPIAALEAGRVARASSPAGLVPASGSGAGMAEPAAGVAAAVLSIESACTELQVAMRLLELQAAGSQAQQLAAVPADIAAALAADLVGLPRDLLQSPCMEPAAGQDGSTHATHREHPRLVSAPHPAAPASATAPAPDPAAAVLRAAPSEAPPAASTSSPAAACSAAQPVAQALPAVLLSNMGQAGHAAKTSAAAGYLPPGTHSALSAQVAQMEAHLQHLVHTSSEQLARASTATALHEQEQAARRRAQDLAAELSAQLAATQADLAVAREQRDQLDAQSRRLARELRDAIYSLAQLHAQQQGQAVSWAVRGLSSTAVQTQYCELWEANLGCSAGYATNGSTSRTGAGCGVDATDAAGSDGSSVLCTAQSSASSGSEDGGPPGAAAEAEAAPAAQAAPRVLLLPALQQQIRELYRAKAVHDIAVARGQRPFLPLADFVAAQLALQSGAEGPAAQQRAQQLQASVEAHAGVREVALFGLAAGMLEEACCAPAEALAGAAAAGVVVLAATPGTTGQGAGSALAPAPTAEAAAVPLVLYNSRRRGSTATARQWDNALPALRRFCAASWHAAYLQSAARPALPQPFDPAGPAQLLHAMAAEVHNLALSVPGVEQLMCWVLGGGLASVDLGLRLAESQVPQLYLLAVDSCRQLGITTTPQLFVQSSSEAAAYYLLLPAEARLHGLNGSLAHPAAAGGGVEGMPDALTASARERAAAAAERQATRVLEAAGLTPRTGSEGSPRPQQPSSGAAGGWGGEGRGAVEAAAAETQQWQCAVVLTSGLIDLLEPQELQAVMVGCLGFHAALASPASSAGEAAAQLAVLCRSMAALATLGALAAFAPDNLARRLPQQMTPFFYSRVQPVLRRVLRYLQLYSDRVAAAAAGNWRPVAAAVVKAAAGCALLRNELNLEAVIEQARALDEATAALLPRALLREEGATMAGAGASLALLRVRDLYKWFGGPPAAMPGQ